MRRTTHAHSALLVGMVVVASAAGSAHAATPTVAQALQLTPIQKDIEYDMPQAEADIAKCTIKAETIDGTTGWVIRGDAGQLLRRFLDTNNDNKVDQWCYYRNGIEVFRDIDANFNGKADQYRWLGIAGTRWGRDENEDGRIDSWQSISAEEVSEEVVVALRDRDAARFGRLLLTKKELESLGLGTARAAELDKKISAAGQEFTELSAAQKAVTAKSQWVHFGAGRPGLVPTGTSGSTKDLTVYENVVAVVESEGKHLQLQLGTLVRVDETWRLIEAPKLPAAGQANTATGLFFQVSLDRRPEVETPPAGSIGQEQQKLITELEVVDKALTAAAAKDQPPLHAKRADLLDQLITASTDPQQRTTWIQQMADTIAAAVQGGTYPDGVKRLESFYGKLAEKEKGGDLAGYVRFRWMSSAYGQSLQAEGADFAKIQEQWLKDLESFVGEYPKLPDAAEAMLQLAIAQEFAGKESDADSWYAKIVARFPGSSIAAKAQGARVRLNSVGKPITLKGQTLSSRPFDLAALRGRVVVIHYWATWCEPCKQEMETLRNLQAKYAQGLVVVGINLDNDKQLAAQHVTQARISWPQLFEPGGLESRLANELGILTLPTMILVDAQGKVSHRSIHAAELETELKKHFK